MPPDDDNDEGDDDDDDDDGGSDDDDDEHLEAGTLSPKTMIFGNCHHASDRVCLFHFFKSFKIMHIQYPCNVSPRYCEHLSILNKMQKTFHMLCLEYFKF